MNRSSAIIGAERKMRHILPVVVAGWIFLAAAPRQAGAQEQIVTGIRLRAPCVLGIKVGDLFDSTGDGARSLLASLIAGEADSNSALRGVPVRDISWVVHLVRWGVGDIARERWFVFHHDSSWTGRKIDATRLYGVSSLGFVAAHGNAGSLDIEYRLAVQKAPSAARESLGQLLEIASGGLGTAGTQPLLLQENWRCGSRVISIAHVPSEIRISLFHVRGDGTEPREASKMAFRNEGLSRVDFTVGLPVKRIKELQYVAEGGTVRAKEIDRQHLIAFMHFFFLGRYDTRARPGTMPVSLVAGVAMSDKPLDRFVLGLSKGFPWANLFAGVAINRVSEPRTLRVESPASESELNADLRATSERKFVWGLSISPQVVLNALR